MMFDASDLIVAIGLLIFIEGLLFAGFPGYIRARMREILAMDESATRLIGLVGAVLGLGIVFLVRYFWVAS